jgi:phage gp29-like protein
MKKNGSTLEHLKPTSEITADGGKKPIILNELRVRAINRQNLDINKWRSAVQSFESTFPNRAALYDIYHDCLLDGHLLSVYDKRVMAVSNVDWEFIDDNGEKNEEVEKWIDSDDFSKTVEEILKAKLWGYSMLVFDFYVEYGPRVFLVPRKHMLPEAGAIIKEQAGLSPISIRSGVYSRQVVEIGEEKALGILATAAQYVIYKRGNIGDWAQFNEVFGMPLIDAVWDGQDEEQKQKLVEAFEAMGAGGQLIRPEGTEVSFIQATSTVQTGELYDKMASFCNKEISKTLLGQTETTESSDSSGYAQSATHKDTESDINRSDRKYVSGILNSRIKKVFSDHGWELEGRFRIKDDNEERLSPKDRLDMALSMRQSGVPISDEYFYDNFGIEKPENYEALKAEQRIKEEVQQYAQFSAVDVDKSKKGGGIIRLAKSFF